MKQSFKKMIIATKGLLSFEYFVVHLLLCTRGLSAGRPGFLGLGLKQTVKSRGEKGNANYSGDDIEQRIETNIEDISGRIVGGEAANAGEFPSFVQWGFCGATLIASDILLTASHCDPQGTNEVLVGAYTRWTPEIAPVNSVKRTVIERRIHPKWNISTIQYDAMLMKLDLPVELNPVKLASTNDLHVGQSVTVMGFGSSDARMEIIESDSDIGVSVRNPMDAMEEAEYFDVDSDFSLKTEVLQKVVVNYVAPSECHARFGDFIVEEVHLCAGADEGGKDACIGDSGGPLLAKVGEEYVQYGIVSFGEGCGRPGTPGIYTRISGMQEWINEQICDMTSEKDRNCLPRTAFTETSNMGPSSPPSIIPSSNTPSEAPSTALSESPSESPSGSPSDAPSESPSDSPSEAPSDSPSESPSDTPSGAPSDTQSEAPSDSSSESPSDRLVENRSTSSPSNTVTEAPSSIDGSSRIQPVNLPSATTLPPTAIPSRRPTLSPSMNTGTPTISPTSNPSSSQSPSHDFESMIDNFLEEYLDETASPEPTPSP